MRNNLLIFSLAQLLLILIYAVAMDRSYVAELFGIFALFCGGGAATKGAVTVLQNRGS